MPLSSIAVLIYEIGNTLFSAVEAAVDIGVVSGLVSGVRAAGRVSASDLDVSTCADGPADADGAGAVVSASEFASLDLMSAMI